MVKYVPVKHAMHMHTVPVSQVSYSPVEHVTYVPAEEAPAATESYVPADNVEYVNTADTATCQCPVSENGVITDPERVAYTQTEVVGNTSGGLIADLSDTQAIAGTNGFRDGFEKGKNAALNGEEYKPGNTHDFRKATNGFDESLGDKDIYKDAYRDSFLRGYSAGFRSVSGSD